MGIDPTLSTSYEREMESKKQTEEGNCSEQIPDLKDKGIFQTLPYHYLACQVTSAVSSYKLTISQSRPASFSSTIRFLFIVNPPYLFTVTQAFIRADIHHRFPISCRASSRWVPGIHHEFGFTKGVGTAIRVLEHTFLVVYFSTT